MDNQCSPLLSTWAFCCQGKSMEDLRRSLLYTTLELEQTRVAAQDELRKRDEQLLHFKDLLSNAIRDKDEAQDKYQRLLLEKLLLQQQQQQQQQHHTAPVSGISSIEDETRRGIDSNNSGGGFSSSDCEESIVSSPLIDLSQQITATTLQNQIGNLVTDKPLPEKGKLLEAVRNAGPLLQTLLLAGPLPQWRHPPPPLESFEIPPVTIPSPPLSLSPLLPLPTPQLLHQDSSLISINKGCNRKRFLSDDSPNSESKYQRVVNQ